MLTDYDPRRSQSTRRRTYIVYGSVLVLLLGIGLFSARQVIFRPWTARSTVGIAPYTDGFYVFGGKNDHNQFYDNIMQMDLVHGTLKRVGHLSTPMISPTAVTVGGTIYIMGGTSRGNPSAEVFRLNPTTNKLTVDGSLPGPRSYGAAAALGGNIYYFGGYDGKDYRDDIIRYDPLTHRSTIVGHLPAATEQLAAAADGGAIYVFGGETKGGTFTDDLLRYHLSQTGTLEGGAVGHLPAPRARAQAVAMGDTIYLVGGWSDGPANNMLEIPLSAIGNSSTSGAVAANQVDNIPYDISEAAPVAFGKYLYLVGGREQRYQRQIQIIRFDPSDGSTVNVNLESYAWW